ncbi:hypothetical protein TTHERM_000343441 (macronuclear) [Tetrahymena thermophila SB210]|uniref:Uncharacterized protein n=1 Tax=Tetrahymena thermophila (strain SB210) TaxID=312017 RepID=W7XJ11_TETTS|nr:hypothetical protein TTHERM_000343441 [Tetrahymena thermophila SB210]EWS73779.1 hypothetical protein TTHERM_000343441 [Tetrahymena thermophila SB210]|eukprot:XP_012653659.1 hypothetical protein TTHERM_000343441 [Tetrahymena thermophila SB210]
MNQKINYQCEMIDFIIYQYINQLINIQLNKIRKGKRTQIQISQNLQIIFQFIQNKKIIIKNFKLKKKQINILKQNKNYKLIKQLQFFIQFLIVATQLQKKILSNSNSKTPIFIEVTNDYFGQAKKNIKQQSKCILLRLL